MIGWLTALAIVLVALLLLWLGPRLAAGRAVATQSGQLGEGLEMLASSLGLEICDKQRVFGDRVHRLAGTFNRLGVELEVQIGLNHDYTRLTIAFPQTLDQDLTILSDRKPALRNWLLRQKETEIGVEAFDRNFILLARHEQRLTSLLSPAIRDQLQRLMSMVDDLEIGDETVFLMAREMRDPAEISTLLKKAIEISERIYATAMQLGPSPSKVEATVYEQATTDIYSREEDTVSGEPSSASSESAGGAGRTGSARASS